MSGLKNKKEKILVLASTFPRWQNDTVPMFIYDLCQGLSKYYNITVLAPHFYKAKKYQKMENIDVYRFQYFFPKYEKIALAGGMLPRLSKNPFLIFQIPLFFISEIISTYILVKKLKPKVIYAHWVLPQGLVAFIVSKLTGINYITHSHGSDINSMSKLNFLKKVILNNAQKRLFVSNNLKEKAEQNLKITTKNPKLNPSTPRVSLKNKSSDLFGLVP